MAVAKSVRAEIEPSWNSLEQFIEGETALLHYTDMQCQPWLSQLNPLNHLWTQGLFEAIDGGHITSMEVAEHVRRDRVRPSLLYQVNKRIADSRLLGEEANVLDRFFVPPAAFPHQPIPIRKRAVDYLRTVLTYSLKPRKKL